MNSLFSLQILAEKLSKLNSTQQCIETLSHWCIFHRGKADSVVTTWAKQFHSTDMAQKVPLLYLANDILQNSKRKGDEFITEFWKVLPKALKEVVDKGDDRGKNVVSRLVGIWEERRVFGSHAQSLKAAMLGEEAPPPLALRKKRSRPVKIVKRDSRSVRTKLSIGGAPEKIVSAFHVVLGEYTSEDEETSKCKSSVNRVKKMEKDVEMALRKVDDPSRKILAKGLEEEESILKESIIKLEVVEANRVALISQLQDALNEQESELENLRTQIQVAQAQREEAANMRKHLEGDHILEYKSLDTLRDSNGKPEKTTTKKSAAAIAAEIADKLAASTSSQYIMSSVLSTFAAEEAKNAGLTVSSMPATSFSTAFSMPTPAQHYPVTQNNHYQTAVVPQPSIQGQIPNSQTNYHQPLQYMQPPSGIVGSYDYGSAPPFPPPLPPPSSSYLVSQMVPSMQQPLQMPQQLPSSVGHQQKLSTMGHQHQPSPMGHQQQGLPMGHQQQGLPMGHQQQPITPLSQQLPAPGFQPLAPVQGPGMVYYSHHYQSQ